MSRHLREEIDTKSLLCTSRQPMLGRLRQLERNNRLYSNGRTMDAVMRLANGCSGFTNAARSSGTITDGTSKMGDLMDASHSVPSFTLARPAGMADQFIGHDAASTSSLNFHTDVGTSSRTR